AAKRHRREGNAERRERCGFGDARHVKRAGAGGEERVVRQIDGEAGQADGKLPRRARRREEAGAVRGRQGLQAAGGEGLVWAVQVSAAEEKRAGEVGAHERVTQRVLEGKRIVLRVGKVDAGKVAAEAAAGGDGGENQRARLRVGHGGLGG